MFKKLRNIGDCGIVCDFGDEVNQQLNMNVIKLFHYVRKQVAEGNLKGVLNYTPSYNKLIINFDLEKTSSSEIINFLKSVNFSTMPTEPGGIFTLGVFKRFKKSLGFKSPIKGCPGTKPII